MPPGLGAVVDDLQMPARLPTHRADPPPALAQLERDDHALLVEADVGHGRPPIEVEHPLECGDDAHVALLREPLDFEHPAACLEGRQRVARTHASSERQVAEPDQPRQARASTSQPDHQTRRVQAVRTLDSPGPLRFSPQLIPGSRPEPRQIHPQMARRPRNSNLCVSLTAHALSQDGRAAALLNVSPNTLLAERRGDVKVLRSPPGVRYPPDVKVAGPPPNRRRRNYSYRYSSRSGHFTAARGFSSNGADLSVPIADCRRPRPAQPPRERPARTRLLTDPKLLVGRMV